METIGERLKEERTRLELNQSDFAEKGGVQKHAQIRYEKGERYPDGNYLQAISKVGVDVLYVLTGRKEPNLKMITKDYEGTVSPIRMAMIVQEVARQFDRCGLHAELFKYSGEESNDAELRRLARITILSAEIYNELFLMNPSDSIQDLIRNFASGMALAERSRLREIKEGTDEQPKPSHIPFRR